MEADLISYLMDKVGPATMLLMAVAALWQRQKDHGKRLDDVEQKLWELHGE
jgi:hypothetical protein